MINNSSPTSVRPEHSRGALAQTDNMRPSTSLGTNETGTTVKREELKKAAEAFEAIFMRQMIGSMRQAGLAEGVFGSRATRQFRDTPGPKIAQVNAQAGSVGTREMVHVTFSGT